jgi:hypothetical protein
VNQRNKFFSVLCLAGILSVAALYLVPPSDAPTRTLPEGFSDAEFWNVIDDFSEPGGYFRSDNLVSNESTFQYVIPELTTRTKPGGVYLGVGPDQNFTYIVALRPKLAFITDIRRNNMLLHLMYKALIELSDNRVEFLSKLFSQAIPAKLAKDITTEDLFRIFSAGTKDPELEQQNLRLVLQQLQEHHNFPLTVDDTRNIEYIHRAFGDSGPQIRYSYPNQYGRRFPSYAELMQEEDEEGERHSYMASEENFQLLKKLQIENRIIPVVGDFAGERALRSVGRFLREHGATVTAFYTSNVEFYLFQSDDWRKFLTNVSNMPMDGDSLFIRAYFNTYGRLYNQTFAGPATRSVTLLDNMSGLVAAFEAKQIRTYYDVVQRSLR